LRSRISATFMLSLAAKMDGQTPSTRRLSPRNHGRFFHY
jgi:hypothetical protein